MKKLRPLLLAIPLTIAALASVPSARAQEAACNLDCVFGLHCCIINNHATCVPSSQSCP